MDDEASSWISSQTLTLATTCARCDNINRKRLNAEREFTAHLAHLAIRGILVVSNDENKYVCCSVTSACRAAPSQRYIFRKTPHTRTMMNSAMRVM